MKLMALDLATNTGVAIGDVSGSPLCHSESLGKAAGSQGARFSEALYMTRRLIEQHKPDAIAIEAAVITGVVGGQARLESALGIRGVVMCVAHVKRVAVYEHAVVSIRKHFIGSGKVKRAEAKAATIARCRQLGWHVANDNEADAAALWDFTRAKLRLGATPSAGGLFDGARPC